MPQVIPGKDIESQMSQLMGTWPQESWSDKESFLEKKLWTHQYGASMLARNQPEVQEPKTDTTTNHSEDDNVPPTENTTSQNEEILANAETTNELDMALSSTKVLKGKKKCCMSLWISRTAKY